MVSINIMIVVCSSIPKSVRFGGFSQGLHGGVAFGLAIDIDGTPSPYKK